ncbi:MAG: helix-hairpin-helix domain-containing protein [Candidatus Thorarchaeota archaeon]|nr:helix-hairpin-helix domain-containing protein [Candidatus Thorarchaeota archaeon]
MSRKKWGKSAAKNEKIVRDAIPKSETLSEINQYLEKSRSVTPYDLANRFGIRMSVARKILREKESAGVIVPYIRESGFVVYSTPSEIEKRKVSASVLTNEVFDEIGSSVPSASVIDDDMEAALTAASSAGTIIKPSKLARQRREFGDKKERKERLPEVVVEPLEVETPLSIPEKEKIEKPPAKKPAKKADKKSAAKKEDKKPAAKKPVEKKAEEKPAADKKPAAKKPAAKKPVEKKADKKPAEEKPAAKKPTAKKPAAEKAKKLEVSDIAGVGPKTAEALREGGFKTVAAISKADPAKMAKKIDGVSEAKAKQYIESAKQLIG